MSACVVLSQFNALVNKMESVGLKLCQKRIRPSGDQLNEFQGLYTRFKATLADYDTGIHKLLAMGCPNQEDIQLASHVRSVTCDAPLTSSTVTTLKRNLVLIFTGPTTFTLDSKQVKTRNKQTEMRCEMLGSQHAHVILMWAMALQPSAWKSSGGMTDKTFGFLIEELEDERINRIPPQVSKIVLSLAAEEPMKTSTSFNRFVESVSKLASEPQTPLKRRRTGETPKDPPVFHTTDESEPRGALTTESRVAQHTPKNNSTNIQQNRRKIS